MGRDKALIRIDGVPLWERQLRIVEQLAPAQTFLSGAPRAEWDPARFIVVTDAVADAGPLAGLVAALRACVTPHLLALAVDLPNITSTYLERLLADSRGDIGAVPKNQNNFEPVAAVYPRSCLAAAEQALDQRQYALQTFAARGVAEGWLIARPVSPEEAPLFLNLNTPDDLAVVARHHA